MNEKHEGYSNKETWAVCLFINNNQWARTYSLSLQDNIEKDKEANRDYAYELKLWIETLIDMFWDDIDEEADLSDEWGYGAKKDVQGLVRDIGSIWRVDWKEVAQDQRAE